MKICVFLGPTLEVQAAKKILDAHYLPPVAGGDVYAAMRYEPTVIGIIDGLFEQAPSVRHKEILYALSCGVHVYGASSMGALRAAELSAFGMQGVGRIFRQFETYELEDDDEVAVNHASEEFGYRCMSEAMVNIREGLLRARVQGVVSQTTEATLVGIAKERFYTDRSWPAIYQAGEAAGVDRGELARLRQYIDEQRPDLKREDAERLLHELANLRAQGALAPHSPNFEFQSTPDWRASMEIVDRRSS